MRIADVCGILTLLTDNGGIDVETAVRSRPARCGRALAAIQGVGRHRASTDGAHPVTKVDCEPPGFLQPGDVLSSYIEGIGTLRNRLVASAA